MFRSPDNLWSSVSISLGQTGAGCSISTLQSPRALCREGIEYGNSIPTGTLSYLPHKLCRRDRPRWSERDGSAASARLRVCRGRRDPPRRTADTAIYPAAVQTHLYLSLLISGRCRRRRADRDHRINGRTRANPLFPFATVRIVQYVPLSSSCCINATAFTTEGYVEQI